MNRGWRGPDRVVQACNLDMHHQGADVTLNMFTSLRMISSINWISESLCELRRADESH